MGMRRGEVFNDVQACGAVENDAEWRRVGGYSDEGEDMYKEHPYLLPPDLASVLWRYVDLPQLLWVLESRALWFSRLDQFEDPYEGAPPRPLIGAMAAT